MIVITTDHAAHDPDRFTTPGDGRPFWEVPARADALLAAVNAGGLTPKPAADHGLAPIARIHDADYLSFLQTAFARWQALPGTGPILRAQAYAVRHKARRPDAVAGQAGWYLSANSAPIVGGTWTAALGSAHAVADVEDHTALAGFQHIQALLDRSAQRGIAIRLQRRGGEQIRRLEPALNAYWAKGHDADFDPLGRHRVGRQFGAEDLQPVIQLRDRAAMHGGRGIEQQQTGAAWFGIVRELTGPKGNLLELRHAAQPRPPSSMVMEEAAASFNRRAVHRDFARV